MKSLKVTVIRLFNMRYVTDESNVAEMGSLTICALRYCIGRMSYMPSLIVDATKTNWKLLTEKDKDVIKKDVAEAISDRHLGMVCDK